MWPWEHLAFGYLLYSLSVRALYGRTPRGDATVILALATQAPDLVDKPLAWVLDVFVVGYGAAHSLLVVGPAFAVALVLARRRSDRASRLTGAYVVGHLSHLAGDLVYPLVLGKGLLLDRILWPVATYHPSETSVGVLARVSSYFRGYVHQVLTFDLGPLFLVQVGLVGGVFLLWLVDGVPGVRSLLGAVAGGIERS